MEFTRQPLAFRDQCGVLAVTRFSLAVNRVTKSAEGERQKETEWFTIVAWQKLGETCNTYLHKGSKVFIEGRLQTRKYPDNSGIEPTAVEVIASGLEMLTPNERQAERGSDAFLGEEDDPTEDEHRPMLYELIAGPYQKGATIITSNKSLAAWGELIGDSALMMAMIDLLLLKGEVFYLRGTSYRLRGKEPMALCAKREPAGAAINGKL